MMKSEPNETNMLPDYDIDKPLVGISRTIDEYSTLPDPIKNPEKYLNDYNQSIGSTSITDGLLDSDANHLEDDINLTGENCFVSR